MALLKDLQEYITNRDNERNKFSLARCAASLFAAIGFGIPYSDKRDAWTTIQNIQKNPHHEIKIPDKQFRALNNSRLKDVIMKNHNELPDWFKIKFKTYRDNAAKLERKKFETEQRWTEYLLIK